VVRNLELEATVLQRAEDWWKAHVVTGRMPELDGSEATQKYLAQKFRQAGELLRPASAEEDEWLLKLGKVRREKAALEEAEQFFVAQLKAAIGEAKGLEGPSGRALWSNVKGRTSVDWQGALLELSEELKIPPERLAALRDSFTRQGAPSRAFRPTFFDE